MNLLNSKTTLLIGAIIFLIGYGGLMTEMATSANENNKEYLNLLEDATDCENLGATFDFSTNSCNYFGGM